MATRTRPFLMGAEVEYSMSDSNPRSRSRRPEYHQQLLAAIREQHAWLPDIRTQSGIYIDNGSRYYLDSGHHNELSSPELSTPRQVAVYDRAGEWILRQAIAAVKERHGNSISVTKNNVNFSMPDRAAWGQHEAFMSWIALELAAPQLIPHLVSRIAYAGAGCLAAHPNGMGFELSQRARHMTRLTGKETTQDRAIFCLRAWKSSDSSQAGWIRTNLIAKDSQRCSFGMYLTYGVTGLLYMIMNQGHKIGSKVQLQDAVTAMRTFSLDPWMQASAPLINGASATAIDIQRAYLEEARPHVESGDYPDWTAEVLEHWEQTLDQLETDPMLLADRLDPYLKLAIFTRQLNRNNVSWSALHESLRVLQQLQSVAPPAIVRAILAEDRTDLPEIPYKMLEPTISKQMLEDAGLDNLRFAVRMQALELNYHELGGLFDSLAAAGSVNSMVVDDEAVEHAKHHPPAGGRAEVRGNAIKEMQGGPWVCDWQYVVNYRERKWIDLRNPITSRREVTSLTDEAQPDHHLREVDEILLRFAE